MDVDRAEDAVEEFLNALGVQWTTETIETPARVARYWEEMLEGMKYTNRQIAEMYGKTFHTSNGGEIVKEVNNVYSHCIHHLALMYNMKVVVKYMPVSTDGGDYLVLGLSKIPRIVDMCAKRLQLQERLTSDIGECISLASGSNDVYVEITADHACVAARGAKAEGKTRTVWKSGRYKGED